MRIAVFGGMNMDILGMPSGDFSLRDSVIGSVQMKPGGVGRNIAEHLAANRNTEIHLITALGGDIFAEQLQNDCNQKHILLDYALKTKNPSPAYLAIHDSQGDMIAAINDMTALEALTPETIIHVMNQLPAINFGVLDANLSDKALTVVAEKATFPLIADPVSVEKSTRLCPLLDHLAAIKPNLLEAQAMTGQAKPEDAAQVLLKKGVERVFISMGKEGLYYADLHISGHLPARKIAHGYLTGAGDALCAGLLLSLAKGMNTKAAAQDAQDFAIQFLISTIDKGECL